MIIAEYEGRKLAVPSIGLGAFGEELLPLSVIGQTQRLVEEATAEISLSQMYTGESRYVT